MEITGLMIGSKRGGLKSPSVEGCEVLRDGVYLSAVLPQVLTVCSVIETHSVDACTELMDGST